MMRLLTSLILIPTVTWAVLFAPPPVLGVAVCVFAVLCWHEFAGIAKHYGAQFGTAVGIVPGLAFLLLRQNEALLLIAVVLGAMAAALRCRELRDAMPSAAMFSLGLVYTFGAWRSASGLHEINTYWLLFALTINWVGDSAAYFVGRAVGKHKLAPRISPGKSWEGAAASSIISGIYGVAFVQWLLPGVPLHWAALLAVTGNIVGQLGDLAESALKRGAGVKDSGTLLPGHGGWLDRLDSSLFSMPTVHVLLVLLHLDR